MRRRDIIAALGVMAAGPSQVAAQDRRPAQMGFLSGGRQETSESTLGALTESLTLLGWRAGDTLRIDGRWATGDSAVLPRLAAELVALRPDVIVSTGTTETKALQAATQTIPIIFMQIPADPVAIGLVKRISRPGGNITGFMQGPQFLWGKRIELLTEVLGQPPRHLAWVGNPQNHASELSWTDAREAAAKIGSELKRVDISSASDLKPAFDTLSGTGALLVQWDFLFAAHREQLAALVAQRRLPAIYENREQVIAGGLMSYGADLRENYRQGALYVHKVLNRTAVVGELPVVQASRFEIVLNLKTASTLGLTIPQALINRADEVIE
jgi:putative ABC transport system substrate-binding protein